MADPSGLSWCDRYLATVGNIGKDIYSNISAVTGIFAYLEVKDELIVAGGLMTAEIWELLVDAVGPNQNIVRMNYADNANIQPGDSFDYVFNSPDVDDNGAVLNDTRLLFIGNPASGGTGSFRAGTVTGDEWDAGNRGIDSVAFGEDCRARGDFSLACGNGARSNGIASVSLGTDFQSSADGQNSVILGSLSATTSNNATNSISLSVTGPSPAIFDVGEANSAVVASQAGNNQGVTSAVVGGINNDILSVGGVTTNDCIIAGGTDNVVGSSSQTTSTLQSGIFCGDSNTIVNGAQQGVLRSVVVGGNRNTIEDSAAAGLANSAVLGGAGTTNRGSNAVILGGVDSVIDNGASVAAIVGGVAAPDDHSIGSTTSRSAIIGGRNGTIDTLESVTLGGDGLSLTVAEEANCVACQKLIVAETTRRRGLRIEAGANYFVTFQDNVVVLTNGGAVSITLPDGNGTPGADGAEFFIKAAGTTTFTVNVPVGNNYDGKSAFIANETAHVIFQQSTSTYYELNTR